MNKTAHNLASAVISAVATILLGCSRTDTAQATPALTAFGSDSTVHDFGPISLDDGPIRIQHTFDLSLQNPSELTVLDVKRTCGCVQARLSSHSLAPGRSAQLELAMDLASPGAASQGVALILSNGEVRHYMLKATATLREWISVFQVGEAVEEAGIPLRVQMVSANPEASWRTPPRLVAPTSATLHFESWTPLELPLHGRPARMYGRATLTLTDPVPHNPVEIVLESTTGTKTAGTVRMSKEGTEQ